MAETVANPVGRWFSTLIFTPASFQFGSQTTAGTTVNQPLLVTNTGSTVVDLAAVQISGAGASAFRQTNSCGSSLPAYATCTIFVTYAPTTTGAQAAQITVISGSMSVSTASLFGTSVAGFTVTPGEMSLNYGNTPTGVSSAAQTVTLSNFTTAPISLGAAIIGGTNAGSFSEASECGTQLGASAKCTLAVTFTPATAGSFSASLTIPTSSSFSPTLLLGGTGVMPAATIPGLSYEVIDLGVYGQTSTYAHGMNSSGLVVGSDGPPAGTDSSGVLLGFITDGTYFYDLNPTDLAPTSILPGGPSVQLNAVNDQGQAVGFSINENQSSQVFLLSNGQVTDIGIVGYPTGINASGQIVGNLTASAGSSPGAFFYSGGQQTALPNLGGVSNANGINASGQVAMFSLLADGSEHAAIFDGNNLTDIGTLGGNCSAASAINASGQAVGFSSLTGSTATDCSNVHAFLYSGGEMTDLGTLGGAFSSGAAINAAGTIVGTSTVPSGYSHAFIYSNGRMVDLNQLIGGSQFAPYVTLESAVAINDKGWIAADGEDTRGIVYHAYLLKPVQ